MTANVEPEEAEALQDLAEDESRASAVTEAVQRDFREPRRFSGAALDGLRRSLENSLPQLEHAFRELLPKPEEDRQ